MVNIVNSLNRLNFIQSVKGDIVIWIVIERADAGRIEKSPPIDNVIPPIEFRDPINKQQPVFLE